jgi:UDP-N-acetylglucosamine--N-acetylmuramyl-(pentapeptide) pyrophosphoryl-undecaprenol N-acetylglucosamine transferase
MFVKQQSFRKQPLYTLEEASMRILISGGGTGGHIYPALALIKEIQEQQPNATFLYVGTERGLEKKIVVNGGIPFQSIFITGFKRKISLHNVKTVYRFIKGTSDSKKIIKKFKPDVVIGTGGYVCGPVVYAAAQLNIPTIIHEQNSVPGLTNKFLSKYVDKVAICFQEAAAFFPEQKVILTGNPRATEVSKHHSLDKQSLGLNPSKKTVMIVGGSRGARPINDACINALQEFLKREYEVLYITGEVHYDKVIEEVNKVGNLSNVMIKPFLDNMPDYLMNIDLIVARAGATTLAEITALGIPSILIPSPYVTNNHQEKNARALERNGAARIVLESNLTATALVDEIDDILYDSNNWNEMKINSKKIGMPDASLRIYKLIQELIREN